jgi:hypothetical protein
VANVETQPIPLGIGARAKRKLRSVVSRVRGTAREHFFPFRVRWLSGARSISAAADEFVVVCLVRNGAIYLQEFLRHYRELGAKHIVLLDNNSNDGTPELVAGESDVTVLSTPAPYKRYKDIMKRWLVAHFGRGNWVLCVDVDELFDYPFRSEIGTTDLLRYLNRRGFTALVAQMLDLFPRGAITEVSSNDWRSEHRCYNLTDVEKESYAAFYGDSNETPPGDLELFRGGIRLSAFGAKPLLTKHPLLFPQAGLTYVNAHHVNGARVADLTAVLLHYKYVGDFVDYVKKIVATESFWNNSREYKQYLDAIESDPQLSLYSGTASELSTVERLLEQGFLVASDSFRDEVEALRRRN